MIYNTNKNISKFIIFILFVGLTLESSFAQGALKKNSNVTPLEIKEGEYKKDPEARGFSRRPYDNHPEIDPFDDSYKKWLKEVREKAEGKNDELDPVYEDFVKDLGVQLFSLGEDQLSPDSKDILASIPAEGLPATERTLTPKPVDIDRERPTTIPKKEDEEISVSREDEEFQEGEVGLHISVKKQDDSVLRHLQMAYQALISGQIESAAPYYRKVIQIDPNNKQALFGLASTYHKAGQMEKARKYYIKLLREDQEYWPALNNLLVIISQEAPKDALRQLLELEQVNPEFSPIPAHIGMIYIRLNRPKEAAKYLTRAVMLSPENINYRYNLAILLDHMGNKRTASKLYRQLLNAAREGNALPENPSRIQERLSKIASTQ